MAGKSETGASKITLDEIDWLALYALSIKHRGSKCLILGELKSRLEEAVSVGDRGKSAVIARTILFYEEKGESAVLEAENRYIASRASDWF